MADAFVEFDHVDLAYDEAGGNAIEDISMSMREGEFIAIVGPSGCGKSTFMKLCTGLKAPRLALMASQVSDAFNTKSRVKPQEAWNGSFLPSAAERNIFAVKK